jgi:uncharacterized lipoprotein YddW (UPF0748 family)
VTSPARTALLAGLAVLTAACQLQVEEPPPRPPALPPDAPVEVRSIWVTRWDYRSPRDVARIMENAAALGFNTVWFQVRGNGTVYYPSAIEPWAWELTSDGPETTGRDPGWDPLAVAIREAHARGLELHAYVNVFPAWRTQRYPPPASGQLWWARPDWFMADAAGRRMIPRDNAVNPDVGDWYSFVSPGVPEVQDYLASLFAELAANYEIDGLHYDYIRYPFEIQEVQEGYDDRAQHLGNWSYDAVSLARFSRETGAASPDTDPEAWRDWRVAQVTATVRKIHEAVSAHRPGIVFTASVMADPDDARETKYQDYVAWLEEGILDAAIVMNYTDDVERFRKRAAMLLDARPAAGWVVQGPILRHGAEVARQQLDVAEALGADGYSIFSYSSLFDREAGHTRRPLADELAPRLLREPARTPWGR